MMLADFLHFIRKHDLFKAQDRVLLAVSGGIDSMVMVDLFVRAGFSFGIAHCNFGLRGQDSDGDELFGKKKAGEIGCPFHSRRFETESYGLERGISIQMAARDLRYRWFEEIKHQSGYNHIATAHHLNDNIETVLFNLIRGTGLKGLTGIPVRQDPLIRPLLFVEKDRITQYAAKHKVRYREDRSNLENKYHRNLIRNEILPLICRINPGFTGSIRSSIERLKETRELIDHWMIEKRESLIHQEGPDIYIDRSAIFRIKSPVFLHEILRTWGFNYDQCRDMLSQEDSGSGSLFYSESHVLNMDREMLIISPASQEGEDTYEWSVNELVLHTVFGRFRKKIISKNQRVKSDDPHCEIFDLERLEFPLKIRTWKEGDWFIPLGMKGKKKLSDFMIDKKIPVNLKQRIPVIFSEESVIWIVGHRMDSRFRITPDTRKLLMISFEPIHDQSF
jgi:tRNA(Ile)-lysidine synthase